MRLLLPRQALLFESPFMQLEQSRPVSHVDLEDTVLRWTRPANGDDRRRLAGIRLVESNALLSQRLDEAVGDP